MSEPDLIYTSPYSFSCRQRVVLAVAPVAIAAVLIERFTVGMPIPQRFAAGILLISAMALPIESWLIINGFRVYGESAVANFSGFTTPVSGVAVEVAFAVPCYMALVVAFIRFWEIVMDNEL